MTRTKSYLASNPDRKSKAGRKSKGPITIVSLQKNSGATIVQHQAVIPSGSHQAVRIMEGSGHEQPVEASKSQGKKVVVSKGLVETLNHGIKVGKSAASRVVPRMSPATLARHLSEQLDAGDLPDGQLVGGDHDVVLEHSSDDEVAFLVEFQPVEMSEDSRHGTGVFGEDQ
ncbi:hypothetical protein V6N13_107704 [Hibiscus sabdariffa]